MGTYLGIDPGQTGALAIIQGPDMANTIDMPLLGGKYPDIDGMNSFLWWPIDFAVIEKAQPMPKQGVTSSFNYGVGYGMLLAWLHTKGIPYKEVRPTAWKKYFGLIGKDKDESRRKAIQLFPWVDLKRKKDHGRAEALLLAAYAKHCTNQYL